MNNQLTLKVTAKQALTIILGAYLIPSISLAGIKPSHCPSAKALHFNPASSRFEAKTQDNTKWKSDEMATIGATSKIHYIKTLPMGHESRATVVCSYLLGENHIAMKSKHFFSLDKHWIKTKNHLDNTYSYSCKKGGVCDFFQRG